MDDYHAVDWDALDPDAPKLRPLLDFAVALTHAPNGGGEVGSRPPVAGSKPPVGDPATGGLAIAALRAAGWGDAAILEAVEVIGFFNYYNRMVDALGVAPEPEWGA